MPTYDTINRCFELTDAIVAEATLSRGGTKALLDRLAKIAKPNEGAPKILLVFARMATGACEWLDGDLRVEMVGDGDLSVVDVMTELGGGLRERALPSFVVNVPVVEFARAVERVPRMIAPLNVRSKSERRLVLVTALDYQGRSRPPPPVPIAEEHLVEVPRSPNTTTGLETNATADEKGGDETDPKWEG
jgi:hypothetical protein